MRTWVVLLCLGHVSVVLLPPGAQAKRYDPSMVDPLSRRSSLDKNFMRFGRSSPSFTEEDETKDTADALSGAEPNKEENFLRSMRGKDNFIRFGRARNGNFMRFGRGKQDNFMRFGKSVDDKLLRVSRGKHDSFMRFGRGEKLPEQLPVFVRPGEIRVRRGKQDNFIRFGRELQGPYKRSGENMENNYEKYCTDSLENMKKCTIILSSNKRLADELGIGVPVATRSSGSNYMRFGKAKHDNFMRFGKSTGKINWLSSNEENKITEVKVPEITENYNNYTRLGKILTAELDIGVPIEMRSSGNDFVRFGRAKNDNFMRFGKSTEEKGPEKTGYMEFSDRFGRQPSNKNDGFIRFGRTLKLQPELPSKSELIPPRARRYVPIIYEYQDMFLPENQDEVYGHIVIPLSSIQDDLEEEYSPQDPQENYTNQRKRSVSYDSPTPRPLEEEDSSVDYISAKLQIGSPAKPDYQSTLLSAGLPNVIVGPEFSLLPDLDPPSTMLKRGRLGDKNFLRLG